MESQPFFTSTHLDLQGGKHLNDDQGLPDLDLPALATKIPATIPTVPTIVPEIPAENPSEIPIFGQDQHLKTSSLVRFKGSPFVDHRKQQLISAP